MQVTKRDRTKQDWDSKKIVHAILCAAESAKQPIPDIEAIMSHIKPRDGIEVEFLQDEVEKAILEEGLEAVYDAYHEYRIDRENLRRTRPMPDANALMDYIHASKYARGGETRFETIKRSELMHTDRFPAHADLISEAFHEVYAGRVVPSMRSMQFGGAAVEANNARLYNCGFTHINRVRVFAEIFFCLLSGTGMGISVQYHHVNKLPSIQRISRDVKHYTIPDTIEGWADAVNELMISAFVTGDYVEFDYSQIRDEGMRLKTSGGKAPGHLPLKNMLEKLRAMIMEAAGRRLRPIECYDMVCHIADAVLSGGIRRSSLIVLFSAEDAEMVYAKAAPNFVPLGMEGSHNTQRQMSNNSAVCVKGLTDRETFKRIVEVSREWGDPGFFWTENREWGCNPCGEIGLDPTLDLSFGSDHTHNFNWLYYEQEMMWGDNGHLHDSSDDPGSHAMHCPLKAYGAGTGIQFCNLTEVNMAACNTREEFLGAVKAATVIGTLQATYTRFPYLGPVTEAITKRDALLGVSLTGVYDAPHLWEHFEEAANHATQTNELAADALGIERSARITTIKPSGTASLWLGGVGSGCHPHHARRYFRRVTANPNEDAARLFKERNPHAVDHKPNGDWCLTFCVQAPDNATVLKDLSAMEHMDLIKKLRNEWVLPGSKFASLTHNVSCTVTVDPDDWDAVLDRAFEDQDGAMAFLPRFGDKGWPFAPREEVVTEADESHWRELCTQYQAVDYSTVEFVEIGNACEGAACEIQGN